MLALGATVSTHGQTLPGWRFWDSSDGMAEAYTTRVVSTASGATWLQHGSLTLNLLNGYGPAGATNPHASGPVSCAPDGTLWMWSGKVLHRFHENHWSSFGLPEITQTESLQPVLTQEWEISRQHLTPEGGSPARQAQGSGNLGLVAVSADRVLILIPDRVLEFSANHHREQILLRSSQTRLGAFTGIYSGQSAGVWITGKEGVGRLAPSASLEWMWHEAPPPPPGIGNLRDAVANANGDLYVTGKNGDGTASVFCLTAAIRDEKSKTAVWQKIYDGHTETVRGWPGLEGSVWLQDGNRILELAQGKAKPVERLGALSGIVHSVQPESNGRFWVSTSKGAALYSPPLWRTPPQVRDLDERVSAITEDSQGRLWFASSSALLCFDSGQWRVFALPKRVRTWAIFTDSLVALEGDRIALRTVGPGLLVFDPRAEKFTVVKHPEGRSIRSFVSYHGGLVAETNPPGDPDGFRLEVYDGEHFRTLATGEGWGMKDLRTVMVSRSGEIWIGGPNGFGVTRNGRFERIGANQGYSETGCYLIYEAPDGRLYAGGRESLFVRDAPGRKWRMLQSGLDRVRGMTTSRDGSLWVASGTGLHRYKDGTWISNELDEGLPSSVAYRVFEDHLGRIWAGTGRGLSRYYPDADRDPPATFIAEDQNFHETAPAGQIRVVFAGLDKWKQTAAERLLFSWRVDGGSWTPFSPARAATYRRLPGGKRLIEVRAMDRNGNIEVRPASFAFTVPLPWYQTAAFQLVAGLALAVIVILFSIAILSYRHRGRLIEELHVKKRLEADRQVILEMIARQKPLPVIFQRIARSVAVNCPGALCGVIRMTEGRLEVAAAPSLPDAFKQELEAIRTDRGGFDDLWSELHRTATRHALSGCHFAPIRSGSDELLGAIAVFLRKSEKRPIDLPIVATMSGLASAAIDNSRLYQRLAHQAAHDVLTGLPNRLRFESKLNDALVQARQNGSMLAVFFLDLDRFKQINDSLGHRVGDVLLKQVATRLNGALPPGETLARIGGDEFTVLLQRHVDGDCIEHTANRMLDALRMPYTVEGRELFVSASIGISLYPQDGDDPATLQKHADSAMYRAKFRGKNCYEFFSVDMLHSTASALAMEQVLRKALFGTTEN